MIGRRFSFSDDVLRISSELAKIRQATTSKTEDEPAIKIKKSMLMEAWEHGWRNGDNHVQEPLHESPARVSTSQKMTVSNRYIPFRVCAGDGCNKLVAPEAILCERCGWDGLLRKTDDDHVE